MTLLEFVQARTIEDCEQQIADERRWLLTGIPVEREAEAAAAHDRLASTQWMRLAAALRNLGWAYVRVLWPRALRQRARRYSDHPDYRKEEWKL